MRHRKPRMLKPQIISEGTLRPEDLIPAYLDVLEGLRLSREERKTVRVVRAASDHEGYYEGALGDDADPSEDLNALADIIESHCAPYCYFGSSEGDGACFGVWVDLETLQRDAEEECWREDGAGRHVSPDGRYVRVVSDHGNVSLYRNGKEVWGIV